MKNNLKQLLTGRSNTNPETIIRASAEAKKDSGVNKYRLAARAALLEPMSVTEGHTSWGFAHKDYDKTLPFIQEVSRTITLGRKAGSFLMEAVFRAEGTENDFELSLSAVGRRFDVEMLVDYTTKHKPGGSQACADELLEGIEYGLLTAEPINLQLARSELESYSGDDEDELKRLQGDYIWLKDVYTLPILEQNPNIGDDAITSPTDINP